MIRLQDVLRIKLAHIFTVCHVAHKSTMFFFFSSKKNMNCQHLINQEVHKGLNHNLY